MDSSSFQEQSLFLTLPKELRVAIYELVLSFDKRMRFGNREINDPNLSQWPLQPGLSRTCRLLRNETLEMYYSTTQFYLNIQRPSGEAVVLNWIDSLASSNAFKSIQHVTIIAGLGYREPPKQYRFNIQQPLLISATRPCAAAYLYCNRSSPHSWTPLVSGQLKKRLRTLPGRDSPDFDASRNLRNVIALAGELSGYGIYDDFPSLSAAENVLPEIEDQRQEPQLANKSPLLGLPKELRLNIWEYALSEAEATIGRSAVHESSLADWSVWPSLTHTCSLFRQESVRIYFSSTHFILNIQRIPCEEIVLGWIDRCSRSYPEAFQNICHVSVTAGSGIRRPPLQYRFLIKQNVLLSATTLLPQRRYHLPPQRWSPPPWDQLRGRLLEMPRKGDEGFDVAQNLRGIIDVLARYSD